MFCFLRREKNIEKILAWIEIKSGQHLHEDFNTDTVRNVRNALTLPWHGVCYLRFRIMVRRSWQCLEVTVFPFVCTHSAKPPGESRFAPALPPTWLRWTTGRSCKVVSSLWWRHCKQPVHFALQFAWCCRCLDCSVTASYATLCLRHTVSGSKHDVTRKRNLNE